jgi:peptidoglycan/LPS O-acetylase OafA/YrhL
MTDTSPTTPKSPSVPVRGGIAVVVGVLANAAPALGANAFDIAPEFRALTIPPVAFLSALGTVGATVFYWFLRRRRSDADRLSGRIAAGVLLLSLIPDVGLLAVDPAATPLAVVVLMVMHVVVAAVSVGLLVSWGTEQ